MFTRTANKNRLCQRNKMARKAVRMLLSSMSSSQQPLEAALQDRAKGGKAWPHLTRRFQKGEFIPKGANVRHANEPLTPGFPSFLPRTDTVVTDSHTGEMFLPSPSRLPLRDQETWQPSLCYKRGLFCSWLSRTAPFDTKEHLTTVTIFHTLGVST